MKRNFLLMLLLTLLPLAGLAETVTTVTVPAGGGYEAKLDQTETWIAAGTGLPTVVEITRNTEPVAGTISPALNGTYKVVKYDGEKMVEVSKNTQASPLTVGNYYLEFTITGTNTMNTVYVPFQVAQEVPQRDDDEGIPGYEFIWDEETFVNSCTDGALKLYYDAYAPQFDSERGNWNVVASTADGKFAAVEGLPWIAFEAPESGSYKVMFTYDDPTINENNPCNPWCEKDVQTFGKTGTDRRFGLASVAERTSFNHPAWQIGVDPDNEWALVGNSPDPEHPEEGAFNVNKFHMYWIPADPINAIVVDPEESTRTDISTWTWALPEITFDGQEQKLDAFFEAETAKVQEDASSTTHLTFGTDFTATYVDGGDYTNAGEGKSVTITGIGAYKGSFTKTYTILPYELTVANFYLDPAGPTFTWTGQPVQPAVKGWGVEVAPDPTAEATEPAPVALGTSDFTTKLYKVGESSDTEVDAAVATGEYYYIVYPKGNYKDQMVDDQPIKLTFTVQGISLSNLAVVTMPQVGDPAANGYVYNTKEQKPVFTTTSTATADATVKYNKGTEAEPVMVTLVEGTDFEVVPMLGANYTNVGEKQITIRFIGGYSGEKAVNYSIVAKNIAEDEVVKNFTAPTFNPSGSVQITSDNFDLKYNDVALVLGQEAEGDFSWAWKEGSTGESGSQTIVVTGKGNYSGKWETTFNVKAFTVTITPLETHKYYGEPDPAPNFSIDANSASPIVYGDDEWKYIQSFLVIERNTTADNNSDELREQVVEGGHKYAIKIKDPDAECNYEILIQNNDANLFIYPAPLNVHVANNSKTYGDPDPNFIADKSETEKFSITLNKPGKAAVDVTNAKDLVDATKNLKDVLNIGRVAGEDVKDSPYDFTWDNPNYAVTFVPVEDEVQEQFTINPKQIQIEVAFDGNGYEYKGAEWNPMPTVTIKNTDTQLVNPKDFAITYAPGTGLNDLINVTEGNNTTNNRWPKGTVSQAANGNYTFTSVEAYFKITKAELNITALTDNSKAYGTADPSPLSIPTFATGKGPKGRDNDGNGQLKSDVTFYKNGQPNTAAPLIIREKAGTEAGEHTGNYVISINPDARTRNYNIVSSATANFLIYRTDQILISFDSPKNIIYGDALDLKTLITYTAPAGVDLSDLKTDVEKNVKKYQYIDPETGEVDNVSGEKTFITTNNVGTYHLTIDDYPTAYKNYDVVLTEGILNIDYYPLYIRAVDSKEYGDREPVTYDWDVYEKVKVNGVDTYVKFTRDEITVPDAENIGNTGDRLADLWNYTISRERGEDVGHYATTIRNSRLAGALGQRTVYYNTQYDGNYSFTFAQGDFEITRRALTVAVTGAEKFYGEFDPEMEDGVWVLSKDLDENTDDNVSVFTKGLVKITITNALPRDLEMIAGKVTFTSRDGGEVVKAGGYQVKNVNFDGVPLPGAARLDNYTLSYSNNANFMINKRVLKVTAHDQSVPYAQPLVVEPYDLTVDGILIDNVYQTANPKGVKYFDDVTVMSGKGTTTTAPAISDQVDEVFKPLEVVEGKTAVGVFHRDAYKLELTDAAKQNYELEFTNGKLYIEQATDLYLDMANLAQALEDHKGRTVNVHMAGAATPEDGCDPFREFGPQRWYTLVLPFRAFPRDIVKPFTYGVVDVLNKDNNTAGSFSLGVTTARVEANTPFIIQIDNGQFNDYEAMKNVVWENKTIANFDYLNADPTATDKAGNKLIGTYKPKSEFTDANYIMREGIGEFFRFIDGAAYNMKQTEAYLESANPAAAARIFIDEEDGTVTAIDFVEGEARKSAMDAEGWYTIDGKKLNVAPTQKGIYIQNGKKVLVK